MSSLAVMLVSMIGCAVCFALFVLFGRMDLKRRGRKYDYLSGFIFEHGEVSDKLGIASRTMLSLFFAFGVLGCFVLSFSEETSGLLGLLVLLGVLALLEGISGEAISIVPAYAFGPHLSSTVAFFFSSIMVDVVSGICLLNCYGKGNEGTEAPLAFAIILFLLALAKGILLVNPKLSRWTELSSYMDQDGVVTTKRPRPFVLASSQWACLLLDLASFLLIALGSYLTLSLFDY